jgi:hypothetical protein
VATRHRRLRDNVVLGGFIFGKNMRGTVVK